jgi:HD-GYP domain-containing protein (c-di-GMP phosphodiesterase class II)
MTVETRGSRAPVCPEGGTSGELIARPSASQVVDRLIRRLRVSDAPERFQKLACEAVRAALGVEAVAWVPAARREAVVVAGQVDRLDVDSLRELTPESTSGVWVSGRSSRAPDSPLRQVAVAHGLGDADATVGWLVAANPIGATTFGPEVELLPTAAALIATQRGNARLYGDLKELLFGVIRSLTAAIDAKDPYTSGHSERVARIAVRIAEELGLSSSERGDLYLMGLLHDVGKIGIQDEVLKKAGKLTSDEYRHIKGHVGIGVHILTDLKKLHHLLPGVAHHHECYDGSGYPAGLAGDQIPLCARILAVADAFDAMSSNRPYRRRLAPDQIDEIFRKGAGAQWDRRVVEAMFRCRADVERIRQKGLGESLRQAVGGTLGRG